VSALDFSASQPGLLAVGMQNGCLLLHNMRHTEESPGRR